MQQYGEKKSGGRQAEFQERIRKEWECLHCGGSFLVSDSTARQYLKVADLTRKNQCLSKLRQFRKWRAKIQDTLLGLTGISKSDYYYAFCVIITSLLPFMIVIMALLLHIFTSLLQHFYALIFLLLHPMIIITCYYCNNEPSIPIMTVILDPLLQ